LLKKLHPNKIKMKHKNFAVVLAGCGVYDGTEIHEAVCTLLAIDKTGSTYQCFAPDINQYHVIDHLTGNIVNETRNVLTESARIARGNVKELDQFSPEDFDAIIFPGGFGVVKNLCTFAIDGADCLINPVVERSLQKAFQAKLPIGALCIAPALVAKANHDITITIGSDRTTAQAIESMGAIHQRTEGSDVVIDFENNIVSSPCYMNNTSITKIAEGVENVINALYQLMNK
jgi:enhancing lycopene biosynthesis protein 2